MLPKETQSTAPLGVAFIDKTFGALQLPRRENIPPLVCLLGRPGSGKSALFKHLVKFLPDIWRETPFESISLGEELRKRFWPREEGTVKLHPSSCILDTQNAEHISREMSRGKLLTDDLILPWMAQILQRSLAEGKGLLIDGFPRKALQRDSLSYLQEKFGAPIILIHVQASELTLEKRTISMGTQRLRERLDDNAATLRFRAQEFFEHTQPILLEEGSPFQKIVVDTSNVDNEGQGAVNEEIARAMIYECLSALRLAYEKSFPHNSAPGCRHLEL